MARGVQEETSSVSLFPFLSILACVIGTLVLMITALALSQMGAKPDDTAIERATRHQQQKRELTDLRIQATQLDASLNQAREAASRARADREELERLRVQIEQREASREQVAARKDEATRELEELAAALAALRAQQEKGRLAVDTLQREWVRRTREPDAGAVKVQPAGGGFAHRMRPVFAEVNAEGLTSYAGSPPVTIPASALNPNHADLQRIFDQVGNQGNGILIYLVRENGVDQWVRLRNWTDKAGIRAGHLPVPGEGTLDLSLFGVAP